MTNQKSFVKPVAMLFCLLILAFSSSRIVNGQKGQLPDKPKGSTEDYVIIEGDIQVSRSFYQELVAAARSPQSAVVRHPTKLWPGGVVPFEFDDNVSADNQTKMINAMAVLEGGANVDFRQCENNDCTVPFYVHIKDSDKNSSWIGMRPLLGGQYIHIFNWDHKFIMAHELMHCLGFFHEQSRSNRDNYVRINCYNVLDVCGLIGLFPDYSSNFKIDSDATGYGSYDFDSVMHYCQCSFSRNANCPTPSTEFPDGGVTITVLPPNDTVWQRRIGQRDHLSELDRASLSFLYPAPNWRFLNVDYGGERGSSNGTFLRPYTTFAQAVANTPEGGTIWLLQTQTIPAVGTYSKRITVKVAPGVEAILGG
jgi:hypothetical protein